MVASCPTASHDETMAAKPIPMMRKNSILPIDISFFLLVTDMRERQESNGVADRYEQCGGDTRQNEKPSCFAHIRPCQITSA